MAKIIKKVLLCPPDHFQVRYQINPWMKLDNPINQARAKNQWLGLANLYRALGIKIKLIPPRPNLPDMIFTADQGLVKNNSVILANFRFRQRQPETRIYHNWFKKQGFKIFSLPKDFYFEGGDALEAGNKIVIGYGFRTSLRSLPLISNLLKTPVISLRLVNPYFYHLDTCLFIPNPKTAFYYPGAFDQPSRKKLSQNFPNLISLPREEAFLLAANSLNSDHQAIIPKGAPVFAKKLAQLGYQAHQINISEFAKAGGGIHCLTITTKAD